MAESAKKFLLGVFTPEQNAPATSVPAVQPVSKTPHTGGNEQSAQSAQSVQHVQSTPSDLDIALKHEDTWKNMNVSGLGQQAARSHAQSANGAASANASISTHSALKQSARSHNVVEKEIRKNLRHGAMHKIKIMAEQINMDILEPHALLVLLICNLKVPYIADVLRQYATKRGLIQSNADNSDNSDTSDNSDNAGNATDAVVDDDDASSVCSNVSRTSMMSDVSNFSMSSVTSAFTDALSMQLSKGVEVKMGELSQNPDNVFVSVVQHARTYSRHAFNTVLDWDTLLSYIELDADVTNYAVQSFNEAVAHAGLPAPRCPACALLHISIVQIPGAKLLEQLLKKQPHYVSIDDLETHCHRVVSHYNDKRPTPNVEMQYFYEILLSCRVSEQFFIHMAEFLQHSHKTLLDIKAKPVPRRLRLRHNEVRAKTTDNVTISTHTFQTWAAQQKFSVHSGRLMQLVLYFIVAQPRRVPLEIYESRFDKNTIAKLESNSCLAVIDRDALLELLRSVRSYSSTVSNMWDFQNTCLSVLSEKYQQALTPAMRFVLYVIVFQHESVRSQLWKQILPVYNFTIKQNILRFCQAHECDYVGVLNNFFTIHSQNQALERRSRT